MVMDLGGSGIRPDRGLQTRMLITMLLLGVVYGVFIIVLWQVGAAFALVFVSIMVVVQLLMSDRMVLAAMHAKVVSEAEQPRLHAMVGRLAAQAGIPKPRVAVARMAMPTPSPRGVAASTPRSRSRKASWTCCPMLSWRACWRTR